MPASSTKRKQIVALIPTEFYTQLQGLAVEESRSLSNLVEYLLRRAIGAGLTSGAVPEHMLPRDPEPGDDGLRYEPVE